MTTIFDKLTETSRLDDFKEKLLSLNDAGVLKGTALTGAGKFGLAIKNIAVNVGISLLITAVFKLISAFSELDSKIRSSASEISANFKTSQSEISDYKSKVEELQKTISDSSSSYSDVTEARKQLITIQNEMIDKYGTEKSSIKAITDANNITI